MSLLTRTLLPLMLLWPCAEHALAELRLPSGAASGVRSR